MLTPSLNVNTESYSYDRIPKQRCLVFTVTARYHSCKKVVQSLRRRSDLSLTLVVRPSPPQAPPARRRRPQPAAGAPREGKGVRGLPGITPLTLAADARSTKYLLSCTRRVAPTCP